MIFRSIVTNFNKILHSKLIYRKSTILKQKSTIEIRVVGSKFTARWLHVANRTKKNNSQLKRTGKKWEKKVRTRPELNQTRRTEKSGCRTKERKSENKHTHKITTSAKTKVTRELESGSKREKGGKQRLLTIKKRRKQTVIG